VTGAQAFDRTLPEDAAEGNSSATAPSRLAAPQKWLAAARCKLFWRGASCFGVVQAPFGVAQAPFGVVQAVLAGRKVLLAGRKVLLAGRKVLLAGRKAI